VILRDPRTGHVRSILRGARAEELSQAGAAGGLTPGTGPTVLSSRGIPGAEAWRR